MISWIEKFPKLCSSFLRKLPKIIATFVKNFSTVEKKFSITFASFVTRVRIIRHISKTKRFNKAHEVNETI